MTSLIKLFNLDGEFAVMVDNLGTRFRIIRQVRYTYKFTHWRLFALFRKCPSVTVSNVARCQ